MNKYYTPKIEEFCVGFECEALVSFKDQNTEEWLPLIMAGVGPEVIGYHQNNWYRVKSLDKVDIESLGFTHLGSLWFQNDAGDRIRKWKGSQVDIYTDWTVGTPSDHTLRFRGSIKNKSELKRVLTQIGVIYDTN